MNARILTMTIGFSCMLAVAGSAQEKVAVLELGPAPLYPADGQISDELKDRFVFLDYAKGDIVVSYPDENVPGKRKVLRFGRHDQAEPMITSTILSQADGTYIYRYAVRNAPTARRALKSIAIPVAKADKKVTARHPLWAVSSERPEIGHVGEIRPQALVTFNGGSSSHLANGQTMAGFEIVSGFRPGLVIAFAEAAVEAELTDGVWRTLPPPVQEQLSQVMNPDWDTAQAITIGPKFAESDSKAVIAMDFHNSLNKLAVLGPLTKDSPFVTGALATLAFYMSAPDTSSLQMGFLEKAAPGLESEIAAAMRISLR